MNYVYLNFELNIRLTKRMDASWQHKTTFLKTISDSSATAGASAVSATDASPTADPSATTAADSSATTDPTATTQPSADADGTTAATATSVRPTSQRSTQLKSVC